MTLATKDRQAALRRALGRIERASGGERAHLPLGIPEIDGALPGGGLRRGCVHEVGGDAAATAFCAVVLARAGAAGGSLLWLAGNGGLGRLYPPGLLRYGIEPERLVMATGLRRPGDVAWAFEEALRSRAVKGVVAESPPLGTTASRRLMLAAEGSDVVGLLLALGTCGDAGALPTAASRWRIVSASDEEAAPGPDSRDRACGLERRRVRWRTGRTAWRVELLRCRGGKPFERIVRWEDGRAAVAEPGQIPCRI